MLQEIAGAVVSVYCLLDELAARFAAANSLGCPEGCGTCCRSEKVEATVLEMLPLAFHLFATNQAELLLKRLETWDLRQCILYRSDWSQVGQWGCSQYEYRAVVCRLFGYAGNRGKDGEKRFARCPHMSGGGDAQNTKQTVENKLCDFHLEEMPLFAEAGLMLTSLHPALGTRRLPINDALMEALLKVGMFLDYNSALSAECEQPESPPEKPNAPAGGRRKKAA